MMKAEKKMPSMKNVEVSAEKFEELLIGIIKSEYGENVNISNNDKNQTSYKFSINGAHCLIRVSKKDNRNISIYSPREKNPELSYSLCNKVLELHKTGQTICNNLAEEDSSNTTTEVENDPLTNLFPSVINFCPTKLVMFYRSAFELEKSRNDRVYDLVSLIISVRWFIEYVFEEQEVKRHSLEAYFYRQDGVIQIRPEILVKLEPHNLADNIIKLYSISQNLVNYIKLEEKRTEEIRASDIIDNRRKYYIDPFNLMEDVARSINMCQNIQL